MYIDAKKLMNQKNYIMKPNKITEMGIEEIKRGMQTSQRSHPAEREEEMLVHTDTIKDDEHKLNAVTTTEETETQQHRDQITKLREKIESTYYQVTQITIDNRPRLQKLQNMFKLKVIMKTANEAMGEILDEKDLNITELNNLIYAAAMVITEEVNGMGEN
jgi:TolA-binding protein